MPTLFQTCTAQRINFFKRSLLTCEWQSEFDAVRSTLLAFVEEVRLKSFKNIQSNLPLYDKYIHELKIELSKHTPQGINSIADIDQKIQILMIHAAVFELIFESSLMLVKKFGTVLDQGLIAKSKTNLNEIGVIAKLLHQPLDELLIGDNPGAQANAKRKLVLCERGLNLIYNTFKALQDASLMSAGDLCSVRSLCLKFLYTKLFSYLRLELEDMAVNELKNMEQFFIFIKTNPALSTNGQYPLTDGEVTAWTREIAHFHTVLDHLTASVISPQIPDKNMNDMVSGYENHDELVEVDDASVPNAKKKGKSKSKKSKKIKKNILDENQTPAPFSPDTDHSNTSNQDDSDHEKSENNANSNDDEEQDVEEDDNQPNQNTGVDSTNEYELNHLLMPAFIENEDDYIYTEDGDAYRYDAATDTYFMEPERKKPENWVEVKKEIIPKNNSKATKKSTTNPDSNKRPMETIWDKIRAKLYKASLDELDTFPEQDRGDLYYLAKEKCLGIMGRDQDAIDALSKTVKTDPIKTWLSFSFYYENLGNNDTAISYCDKILQRDPHHKKALLNKAHNYQKKNMHSVELKSYLKILEREPKDHDTLIGLGRCYQNLNQHDKALEIYAQMLKEKKDDFPALLDQARCFENMQRYEESLQSFDEILSYIPNHKLALLGKSRCYEEAGHCDKALVVLQSMLILFPKDPMVLLAVGHCHRLMENHDKALESFIQIEGTDQENTIQVQVSQARAYQAVEEYHKTVEIMKKALETQPGNLECLLCLAHCYLMMERYEDALKTLQLSLMTNPWDEKTLLSLAVCYQKMGRYKEAIALNQKMLVRNPKHTIFALNMAFTYQLMHRYNNALEVFNSILEYDPKNVEILLGLARCYQEMSQYTQTIAILVDVLSIEPKNKLVLLALAHVYEEVEEFELALNAYGKLLQEEPLNAQFMNAKARCYQAMKLYDKSIEIFKTKNHGKKKVSDLMGQAFCHKDKKEYSEALVCFKKSLEMDPKNEKVVLGLTLVYKQMGNSQLAIDTLTQYNDYKSHPKVSLSLASLYENSKSIDTVKRADETYKDMMIRFPYSQDVVYYYCSYLIKVQSANTDEILTKQLENWPYMARLHLLNAEYKSRLDPLDAGKYFEEVINKFPYYVPAFLSLIRHYVGCNLIEDANRLSQKCIVLFSGHKKLFKQIDKIIQATALTQHWQAVPFAERTARESAGVVILQGCNAVPIICDALEPANAEIDISSNNIINVFNEKSKESTDNSAAKAIQLSFSLIPDAKEAYVVGSAVLSCLGNQALSNSQDIDMVMGPQDIDYMSRNPNFTVSPYMSQLYHAKKGLIKFPLDCYIALTKTQSVAQDTDQRDFTITCIYCNRQGDIIDPSGKGLSDFYSKTLRTMLPADICFDNDPTRLLRAIKFMLLGYEPTEDVSAAMKNWHPLKEPTQGEMDHFNAVLFKNLLKSNKMGFVARLVEYELHTKFFVYFDLDPSIANGPLEALCNELKRLTKKSVKSSTYRDIPTTSASNIPRVQNADPTVNESQMAAIDESPATSLVETMIAPASIATKKSVRFSDNNVTHMVDRIYDTTHFFKREKIPASDQCVVKEGGYYYPRNNKNGTLFQVKSNGKSTASARSSQSRALDSATDTERMTKASTSPENKIIILKRPTA